MSSPVLSPLRGMASKVWGEVGRSFRDNSAAAATPKQEAAVAEASQWELLWAQDLMCPRVHGTLALIPALNQPYPGARARPNPSPRPRPDPNPDPNQVRPLA